MLSYFLFLLCFFVFVLLAERFLPPFTIDGIPGFPTPVKVLFPESMCFFKQHTGAPGWLLSACRMKAQKNEKFIQRASVRDSWLLVL